MAAHLVKANDAQVLAELMQAAIRLQIDPFKSFVAGGLKSHDTELATAT